MKITARLIALVLALLALAAGAYAADESPLHAAVTKGDKAAVEALLAKGAEVNAKDNIGFTPLHIAAYWGKRDIAELLLDMGADVNAKNNDGKTPRHIAASMAKEDVAELLKEFMFRQASGNPPEQLNLMIQLLKEKPYDNALREKIIKLATNIKPAPAIPEEARRSFIIGEALFKQAKNLRPAYEAADAFRTATTLAPWWSNAYWNLAIAQQFAGQYVSAKESLRLYLLTDPSVADRRLAQDRLYAIEADIITTKSNVPSGLTGFWQRSSYKTLTNEWRDDHPDLVSGRATYEIQQTGSAFSITCMTCESHMWTVNVVSSSRDTITFQKRLKGPGYDSGILNYECRLEGNQLSCTETGKDGERLFQRFDKRNVCEIVGGPGIQGYFVGCK